MSAIKLVFKILVTLFLMHGLIFAQDTTLTVTSDGNVGIGTTSPLQLLHVERNADAPIGIIVSNANAQGNAGATLWFRDGSQDVFSVGISRVAAAGAEPFLWTQTGQDLRIGTGTGNQSAERMRIQASSGNIGIGTTSPNAPLHVVRSDTVGDVTTARQIKIGRDNNDAYSLTAGYYQTEAAKPFAGVLQARDNGVGTYLLLNPSGGNVGVGTTSPGAKLQIVGLGRTGTGADGVFLGSSGAFNSIELISPSGGFVDFGANDSDFEGRIMYDATTDFMSFITNGTERARITSSGDVGIGTTSPTHPLEMASGAHVTAGGVWTDASSRQYKEHISNLSAEEAIAALEKLNPVKFNYKVEKDEQYVGFIAEDVPELVATKARKSLSPMDIVAVLTKVVQQQQKRIAELEARLNASQ